MFNSPSQPSLTSTNLELMSRHDAYAGNPRSNSQAPLLNSAKVAETWPCLLTSKTSMPLTFSVPPVPLTEIQRQAILLQLLKISRVWRVSGGCLVEPATKAAMLVKV